MIKMRSNRRRWIGIVTAAVIAALGGLYATSGQADHEDEEVVLAFTTMRGNLPNVDINNNIGGFAPWVIRDGDGVLTTEGHVRIRIRGLLFAPGVPNLGGTNPFKTFRAIVSCTTVNAQGETEVVNISTGAFPADAHGDCNIHDKVTLPNPCYAPIILVGPEGKVATPPDTAITGGIWLAATGF